jgi:hypothetical protein
VGPPRPLTPTTHRSKGSLDNARANLSARLRERRDEIEQAVLARTYAVSDPTESADSEYLQGFRSAISSAIDYGLTVVELGERRTPPIPVALIAQARLAARHGISLEIVVRRYVAGHTLLSDFLAREAEQIPSLQTTVLRQVLSSQGAVFDRLIAAISEEYKREPQARLVSSKARQVERVQRLLAGELVEKSELAYDFDLRHVGVIANGPDAAGSIRDLAKALDSRILLVHPSEQITWGWFGNQDEIDQARFKRLLASGSPTKIFLALGEGADGLPGWRLTHRQAMAALPIALRSGKRVAYYAEAPLLASAIQDDLLATSLRQLYLEPLCQGRDGGLAAKDTLRAYFAAAGNVRSAAAALGVDRHTVSSRLAAVEDRIGRTLAAASAEIRTALHLDEIDGP